MIQFSKPRRPYNRNEGQNRFEHSARDVLNGGMGSNGDCELHTFRFHPLLPAPRVRSKLTCFHFFTARGVASVPSRFDPNFYRTHDAIGHIPSDAQSVRSQATYASGLPTFSQSGSSYPPSVKRGATSSYASSTFSQDLLSHDSASVRDDASSVAGGPAGSIAYSQADRLRDDAGEDYKSQLGWVDDDARSTFSTSQSGVTDY